MTNCSGGSKFACLDGDCVDASPVDFPVRVLPLQRALEALLAASAI